MDADAARAAVRATLERGAWERNAKRRDAKRRKAISTAARRRQVRKGNTYARAKRSGAA